MSDQRVSWCRRRLAVPAGLLLVVLGTPAAWAQPGGGCMGGGGGAGVGMGGGMGGGMRGMPGMGGGGMGGMMGGGMSGGDMMGMVGGGTGSGMAGCTNGMDQMMQAAQARQQMVQAQAMAAIAAERRQRAIDKTLVTARRERLGVDAEIAEQPVTRGEVAVARRWGRRQAALAAMAARRGNASRTLVAVRGMGT